MREHRETRLQAGSVEIKEQDTGYRGVAEEAKGKRYIKRQWPSQGKLSQAITGDGNGGRAGRYIPSRAELKLGLGQMMG